MRRVKVRVEAGTHPQKKSGSSNPAVVQGNPTLMGYTGMGRAVVGG